MANEDECEYLCSTFAMQGLSKQGLLYEAAMYVVCPFIVQLSEQILMFATLLQARKRVKSMRNASSTSSTQRPQKTGNDHVDDAFTNLQIT